MYLEDNLETCSNGHAGCEGIGSCLSCGNDCSCGGSYCVDCFNQKTIDESNESDFVFNEEDSTCERVKNTDKGESVHSIKPVSD